MRVAPAPSSARDLGIIECRRVNTTAATPEARIKRLRWRCRRGTRELDALLGGWLDRNAGADDAAALQAFDALLDRQDPELWDWLMGHTEPPRPDWQAIVADIRKRAGFMS